MGLPKSSRFQVTLDYSLDNVSVKDEFAKRKRLGEGGDRVTSVLKDSGVAYLIFLVSDFHYAEPILSKVTQIGKDGREYEIYGEWKAPAFSPICGSCHVLGYLVSLGVIKDSKILLRK